MELDTIMIITQPRQKSAFLKLAYLTGFFLISVLALPDSLAEITYEHSEEYPPLQLSYEDLRLVLGKARRLIQVANVASSSDNVDESLALEGKGRAIEINDLAKDVLPAGSPKAFHKIRYHFRQSKAPISSVLLLFRDYKRDVYIEGTSSEQIDALAALLSRELGRFGSVGGHDQRLIPMLVLLMVGATFVAASLILDFLSNKTRLLMALVGVVIFLIVTLCPWIDWMPGVAVFQGEASWLIRYGPQMGFFGLVLTIVGLVVGELRHWRRPDDTPETGIKKGEGIKRR